MLVRLKQSDGFLILSVNSVKFVFDIEILENHENNKSKLMLCKNKFRVIANINSDDKSLNYSICLCMYVTLTMPEIQYLVVMIVFYHFKPLQIL